MIPDLPEGVTEDEYSFSDQAALWHLIITELLDEEFAGRTHGNRKTYDSGCKGPICRKAARDHGRRRNQSEPTDEFKRLDLLIQAWTPVAVGRIVWARENMIKELTKEVS